MEARMTTPITAAQARANAAQWYALWNERALGCAPSYKTDEAQREAGAWTLEAKRLEAIEAAQVAA